jgi:hypothetical protein
MTNNNSSSSSNQGSSNSSSSTSSQTTSNQGSQASATVAFKPQIQQPRMIIKDNSLSIREIKSKK